MNEITVSAKTVNDAITEASIQLGVASDQMEYEVIEKGSAGFLGIGSRQAVIRAWKKKVEEPEPVKEKKEFRKEPRKEGKKEGRKENRKDNSRKKDKKYEKRNTNRPVEEKKRAGDRTGKPASGTGSKEGTGNCSCHGRDKENL